VGVASNLNKDLGPKAKDSWCLDQCQKKKTKADNEDDSQKLYEHCRLGKHHNDWVYVG